MQKLIRKTLLFKAENVDEANYIIRGIFSTGSEDRQSEVINQNGWKLEEYMANPVILFAHDHYQPAIGKCVELSKDGMGNLVGAIQFAAEEYDFAKTIFNLYKGGFMRAFSVGFMNEKYEVDQANDRVILSENVLFEISCVNVPANAMALAYSKGIDIAPLEKFQTEQLRKSMEDLKQISGGDNIDKDEPGEAIKTLTASNKETIRTAIKTLTEVLDAAGTDNKVDKVETPERGGKKIPVKLLNKAVRQLLEARAIISRK